ncbi:Ig-like domain-containing protein [Aequorivita echinoideorum]|uniref:Gliding motility-associated C-terminal domain-containing protein n=1 Tax=Aequorivita echinoideorum TaxID=1549647 RepID=A0ABS5S138_9FLAO|nr:gliding motility-associated C-terminal domain-containing protein [Aequorivita echinoideorum]MBT0606693.1 gliding motility-associated C-terminal domain-containing protein [Aequorivita echinoideorum]
MKKHLHLSESLGYTYVLMVLMACSLISSQMALSQTKVLADQVTFQNNVDNANNATLDNNDSATLNSYGGIAVGIGNYSGELELSFPSTVPANTTSYVKIDFDNDVLNALLGGSLGTLLADVLGTVVLGNHFFDIEARNGGTTVLSRSSLVPPSDRRFRIVQDAMGDFYIAITPSQAYDRIYIQDNTSALLLGTSNSMEVYNAFYFSGNQCNIDPLYSDFDGEGITLDLLNLGGAGVENPEFAIDGDEATYSELSLGIVGVLASMQQNVYFPAPYTPTSEFEITLRAEPTLVNLGLLNQVSVRAYNGFNQVYSTNINSLLTLDLLTLLQNGQEATIVFIPGASFDRVTIELESLLNVNIAQSIDIYEINVVGTATPTTNDETQEFCAVDEPTVADIQINETSILWYDSETGGNQLPLTELLVNGEIYYAAQIINGCESEERLAVEITINDTPPPTTTNMDQTFCAIDAPTISDLDAAGPNIVWYDAPTDGNAYASTDLLVDGLTYYASATGTNGCESSVRLAVNVSIEDTPAPTTSNTDQSFCEIDEPTVADLDATGQNIIWYDALMDGNAYALTDLLVDGLTYYASATGTNGCESSIRLAVNVSIEDTPAPTTSSTDQSFCEIDEPKVSDLDATGQNIVWYDAPIDGNAYASTDLLVDGLTYYASATGTNGCESSIRLAVNVSIEDTPAPTTSNTNQSFCTIDAPTISDLDAAGQNIIWYDAPTDGNAYASTDLLVDGLTYYASATGANGCESSVRLAVNVSIEDTPAPTTSNTNQSFCTIDAPTISDLDAAGPNIIWYDAPIDGNAYASTDLLIDGLTYYASATGANGCESSIRLAVNVSIEDTPAPITSNTNQSFCTIDAPTISDLDAAGQNIIWYDAPTNGNAYASTDLLVDGLTYYASATGTNGCESSVRLAVNVSLNVQSNPTISSNNSGNVCLNTAVMYTTESGNSNYIWNFTGGELISGGGSTDDFIEILWTSMDSNTVSVSYHSESDCTSGETFVFNETVMVCADITISKIVNNPTPMIGETIQFTIEVNNLGPNDFTEIEISENIPSGYDYVSHESSIGTYIPTIGIWSIDLLPANETAILTLNVKVLNIGDYLNTATIMRSNPEDMDDSNNYAEMGIEPVCLFVFNEFSPNSDGINDTFTITCIENWPNNNLKVFNRYGSLVYEKNRYDNSWEGRANVSNASRKDEVLPSDTYYYVLDMGDGNKPKVGWLFLIK